MKLYERMLTTVLHEVNLTL